MLAAGFTEAWSQSFEGLADSTYRGAITVEAMAPQTSTPVHRESGSAEITFLLDDQERLQVEGSAMIDGRQALRFDYLLTQADDGAWVDETDDMGMTISPNGDISILAASSGSTISAAGEIDRSTLQLHLRKAANAPAGADGDAELDLVFHFDLASGSKDARSPNAGACSEVVWQPRMIANPFGSSMSSVMVPVCISTP